MENEIDIRYEELIKEFITILQKKIKQIDRKEKCIRLEQKFF